jgi:hypothetical protein
MQLRPRNLDHVDSMARSDRSIADLRMVLCKNYVHFFGRLRPKARTVPSDELRQEIMVAQLLDLVQDRRDWLQRYAQLMER